MKKITLKCWKVLKILKKISGRFGFVKKEKWIAHNAKNKKVRQRGSKMPRLFDLSFGHITDILTCILYADFLTAMLEPQYKDII